MTTKEKIEKIRQICITANPEIAELKFGCELGGLAPVLGRTYFLSKAETEQAYFLDVYPEKWIDIKDHPWYTIMVNKPAVITYEVIGRPIRLADVLFALVSSPDGNGNVRETVTNLWFLDMDDLIRQPDDVLDIILNVLVPTPKISKKKVAKKSPAKKKK